MTAPTTPEPACVRVTWEPAKHPSRPWRVRLMAGDAFQEFSAVTELAAIELVVRGMIGLRTVAAAKGVVR